MRRAYGRSVAALVIAATATMALLGAGGLASASAGFCSGSNWTTASQFQSFVNHRSASWAGADMTQMIHLGPQRQLFLFGDTVYRDVNRDGSYGAWHGFANNSIWMVAGSCARMINAPDYSFVVPPSHSRDHTIYWPSGAIAGSSTITMFFYRMLLDSTFGEGKGLDVVTVRRSDFKVLSITHAPYSSGFAWGKAAVDGRDGYAYVYGTHHDGSCATCFTSSSYVARVLLGSIANATSWRYWNGQGAWVTDVRSAAPIAHGHGADVSVQPYRGGYLMASLVDAVGSDVNGFWSKTPWGPFTSLGSLYRLPSRQPSIRSACHPIGVYRYMASVLPQAALSNGRVLLSYNVNSFGDPHPDCDALMYGVRFVDVNVPTVVGMRSLS